jgi:DNA-binding YbaB/EbfC family protein
MSKQPDFGAILKQAQQMQTEMMKAQEELAKEVVEATVGGGMVAVKMTGDLQLQEINIKPDAVDPDDVEMLQDLVLAAVNEAIRSAQELASSKMNQAAGGMGGLGGLGLPGMSRPCTPRPSTA